MHGGICIGCLVCLHQRLLSGGHIGLRGFLNLAAELCELFALLISEAHFVTACAGGFLTRFLRILGDGLLLLRCIRELLVLLRGCGFRGVCGLLRLGLRLLRSLRGDLRLLFRLAGLLRGLLVFALFLAASLRGFFGCALCALRFVLSLLGCLGCFPCFVRGILRGLGGLLWAAGFRSFLRHLGGVLCSLSGFCRVVSCCVGLLRCLRISRIVGLSLSGLRGFLCSLRCLRCFLGRLCGFTCRVCGWIRRSIRERVWCL